MKIKRLGPTPSQPDTIEINNNYLSFSSLLAVLRKLEGVIVLSHESTIATDDHWADFSYLGYTFTIDSPLVAYWIHRDIKCPPEIFEDIIGHLERHKVAWLRRIIIHTIEAKRKKRFVMFYNDTRNN